MRLLRSLLLITACSIAAQPLADAAPIPTPTPGGAVVLSAPAPNPAQFNFQPLNPLPAAQLMSDIYGPWNEFTALINALNATGAGAYGCGPCVTSVVNGTGLSGSLGAQTAGVGVALTLNLSHGDYVDLSSAQTIGGAKTFTSSQTITTTGNASLTMNSGGTGFSDIILHTPTQSSYIDLFNDNTASSLMQVGNLRSFSTQGQATDIESGLSGGVAANYGSFIAFHTKQDGGADNEALVLTPGAKAYFPGDQYFARFTTPTSCTALVTCGTQTFTFNAPFATTSGAAALPVCTGAGIMDESVPSQMWIVDIQSPLSSSSVTYNYAPTVNLAASHTVDIYVTCWAQAY